LTLLVCAGIRRTNISNIAIVSITIASLIFFVARGYPTASQEAATNFKPFFLLNSDGRIAWSGFLHATALMFVAFTGYGRIATLAEEVVNPRRTIPFAIIATLVAAMLLYMAVAAVAVGAVGVTELTTQRENSLAPLVNVAASFGPTTYWIVSCGGIAAMLGVLLNLILGLSRVVLAMGRRGDLPARLAQIHKTRGTPHYATLLTGLLIVALVLSGDMKTTWSFSAFTVLIYYAITNLAAIRMPASERLYPVGIAWIGLLSCGFLSIWVEPKILIAGVSLIAAGLLGHAFAQWRRSRVTA
jgi:APA family basic amino acid/polyamine antiporter